MMIEITGGELETDERGELVAVFTEIPELWAINVIEAVPDQALERLQALADAEVQRRKDIELSCRESDAIKDFNHP